jgi:hypothetical protein
VAPQSSQRSSGSVTLTPARCAIRASRGELSPRATNGVGLCRVGEGNLHQSILAHQ